jgi:hypothetical protein
MADRATIEAETATRVLSMNCQVQGCPRPAAYVVSGGLSNSRFTCSVHLTDAIDSALGQPILRSKRRPAAQVIVHVTRA